MANCEAVFDIGSKYVSAALKTDGYFVKEPAVVATDGTDGKQSVAAGINAVKIAELNSGKMKLVYPILEGTVVDAEAAKALFKELLDKILPAKAKPFVVFRVTCVVPSGIISSDKKTLENVFLSLGARSVGFIETPLADSKTLFAEFRTNRGIIVNVGSDCSDLAIVYGGSIAAACTLYNAGKYLTQSIAERVCAKYQVQLSFEQAETLKNNCASLYSNDSATCTVSGVNVQTGNPETITVSSKELYDTVVDYAKNYGKLVESLLTSVPDQVGNLVRQEGVFLCGGGAKLAGLDAFLHSETNLPVRVATSPADTSIMGALADDD